MAELLQRYEESTGRSLKVIELRISKKLATSITYLVMQGEPMQIGLKSIDALPKFLSQYLDKLTISDLIEFEVNRQSIRIREKKKLLFLT